MYFWLSTGAVCVVTQLVLTSVLAREDGAKRVRINYLGPPKAARIYI